MNLVIIDDWCYRWCMLLNPSNIKALVVCTSRIVDGTHCELVLPGVPIRACPNHDILGVWFDNKLQFEAHICSIVFRVFQRIGIVRLMKSVFDDASVLLRCYYDFFLTIPEYCSPV